MKKIILNGFIIAVMGGIYAHLCFADLNEPVVSTSSTSSESVANTTTEETNATTSQEPSESPSKNIDNNTPALEAPAPDKKDSVQAPPPEPVKTQPAATQAPVESQVHKALRTGGALPLHNKEEEGFDANGDRKLDSSEIKTFLTHVASVVRSSGSYPVHSDITYEFDRNHDGVITANELPELESYAR